jgi:leucyl-tRNA synthetase
MGYGTGAIMAVPGQDERDWEFAEKYDLPIIRTVQPPEGFDGKAYTGEGPAINSGFLDGLGVDEAKERMIEHLERRGHRTARGHVPHSGLVDLAPALLGDPDPDNLLSRARRRPVPKKDLPVRLRRTRSLCPRASRP